MLSKEKRVPRSVFQKSEGKMVRGTLFSIRFWKTSGKENRYSVVLPKTTEGKAIGRNRTRRRIYEIIQKNSKNHPKPFIYIVYGKKTAEKLSFREIESEISFLFNKIRA